METLNDAPEYQISAIGFKSYYVVWKLQSYVTTEKEKIV